MHVIVELDDGVHLTFPPADWESDSLAAFLILVDVVMGTNITRRSRPKLLKDPNEWALHLGAGGSLPCPDDPEVCDGIRALAQWAAERPPNPLAPFQRFAFENPCTDEGHDLKERAWQGSTDLVLGCWTLCGAIQTEPTLQVLDKKFPFLASPAVLPNRPRSNLDVLRDVARQASVRRLRLLLGT
jgi:hypothetical protein